MKHQISHLLQNSIPEMFSNPTLGSIDINKLNKVKELIETNEILEKSKGFIGAPSMSMGLGGGGFGKGSDTNKEKSGDKESGGGMFGS